VTEDVLLTLSLLLLAALLARFLASLIRIPEILLLVAMGALFGPSALDVIEVPIESLGAQLMFTLGVSLILFYGGLNLSLPVLRKVWMGLGLLVLPGVVATALLVGLMAYLVFDLSFSEAILLGAVLAPTDPAILIPLFVGSRLRPKVAQRWWPNRHSTTPPGPLWHWRWQGWSSPVMLPSPDRWRSLPSTSA